MKTTTRKHKRNHVKELQNKCRVISVSMFFALSAAFSLADSGKFTLDIKSTATDEALLELAEASGTQIIFSSEITNGSRSPAVRGELSIEAALTQLLAGTDLAFEIDGDNTVLIKKKSLAIPNKDTVIDEVMVHEVMVTATKRETSLQDTPMSISVLGSDDIDKRNLVGMADYLSTLPGVNILDQGPGFNSVIMRGLSAQPQLEGAASSPVSGIYFGETPISGLGNNGNSADIKLVDMERIEVLRGPQGSLYGAGAMGGVVRNIPSKPNLGELEGSLQLGYSNTEDQGSDNNTIKAVLNVPVIQDTLAIRAVAYQFKNSGLYNNIAANDPVTSAAATTFSAVAVNRDDIGSNDVVGSRISVLWQPTDNLAVNLSYLTQDTDQHGWGQAEIELSDGWAQRAFQIRNADGSFTDESYSDNIDIANLTVEYDLDWANLISSTSWIDEKSEILRDISLFFGFGYPWSQPLDFSGQAFSEEVRLASDLEGPFQFLVGLYYEDRKTGYDNFGYFGGTDLSLNFFSPGEALVLHRTIDRSIKQEAIFGEVSYDITNQLKLTVGGRAFSYERDLKNQSFAAAFSTDALTKVDSKENDVSLKAGLEYTPDDTALIYLTWSEGFRLGYPVPAEPLPASLCDPNGDGIYDGSNGISTGPRSIDSDYVDNFELGGKFSLLNNQLILNTALYQINWDGIPILQIFDFCSATTNAGKARSRGVELELSYYWNENFLANFSSSYVDAELIEDSEALSAHSGDRLPGSPRYNASLGVEYRFRLANYAAYVRSDYAYIGGFYNNLQESGTEIADFGKFNLKAGINIDQFDIDLYVDNLTNEDALTWIDAEGFPSERGIRLRPRTVGLNVGYRF